MGLIIEDLNIKLSFQNDDDLHVMHGYGDVTVYMDEKDEIVSIGSIYFNFYNVFSFDKFQHVLMSADSISGDEIYMMATLDEDDLEGGSIITLDRIILKEGFASDEIEKVVLQKFIDICCYMMFDYILVIASKPLDLDKEEQPVIEFPQLKLYNGLNFKIIGGSDKKTPVLMKNLHYRD